VFKYAHDAGLIDRPVRFGPMFTKPSRKAMRKARHAKGPRMFEAQEIRTLLDAAGTQVKAMILLGVNCGFGNSDVATLPRKGVELTTAWIDHPRPKTEIQRRVPLWPETVDALAAALQERPQSKDRSHDGLVFVTKYGQPWSNRFRRKKLPSGPQNQDAGEGNGHTLASTDSPITKEFAKLLKSLKIERPGLNFYALRHTFETLGGESRDQVAVDAILGHSREDMASIYRERIRDERLKAVTDYVRAWLFPKAKSRGKPNAERRQRRRLNSGSEKTA
jgi:integrase